MNPLVTALMGALVCGIIIGILVGYSWAAGRQVIHPDFWANPIRRGEARGCYRCDTCSNLRAHGRPCMVCLAAKRARCSLCQDTGLRLEPGEETKTYCDCPVGLAYGAAWSGTGHEEERVEAIDKMLAFLHHEESVEEALR